MEKRCVELETTQAALKQAILRHQRILQQTATGNDDSLKEQLADVQREIQELGEKQKALVSKLRQEHPDHTQQQRITRKSQSFRVQAPVNGAPAQSAAQQAARKPLRIPRGEINSKHGKQTLAVRTISGQTKLLVPVSAAVATAKKPNQPNRILVVSTPGGGARLVTSATNAHNQSANATVNDQSDLSQPRIFRPSRRSVIRSRPVHRIEEIELTSQQQDEQRQIEKQLREMKEKYLLAKHEEEAIPEQKRKEIYLAALDLLTKQALKEIQNKKCERKRRTTANPQFSNAAIEAKRINAMATAERRARRKEQKLAAQEKTLASTRETRTRNGQTNSRKSPPPPQSTSKIASPAPSVNEKRRSLLTEVRRGSNVQNTESHSHQQQQVSREAPKPAEVRHKPQLCCVCAELCNSDLDVIMFCEQCEAYFHATCSATADQINRTKHVPCPRCDRRSANSHREPSSGKSLLAPSNNQARRINVEGNRLKVENGENSRKTLAFKSPSVSIRGRDLATLRKEKQKLLERKQQLAKAMKEDQQRLFQLSATHKSLQEIGTILLKEQEIVLANISKIGDVIKLVKENDLTCDENMDMCLEKPSIVEKALGEDAIIIKHEPSSIDFDPQLVTNDEQIVRDNGLDENGNSEINDEMNDAEDEALSNEASLAVASIQEIEQPVS